VVEPDDPPRPPAAGPSCPECRAAFVLEWGRRLDAEAALAAARAEADRLAELLAAALPMMQWGKIGTYEAMRLRDRIRAVLAARGREGEGRTP
jgi:hypothetical protein